eukprot:gnl/MRDRNA2_/MRDRNA2_94750_c0_seq1.p1 gnl/MRDRNA2_/MRDRNA2_94750_c0~~gnl/MRDRNA2_/MRDRNA2_94750_c0_seq1.p1  ORF type:complete len:230 (-),score=39.04 gnl/MRDRNA2_/MRDRNA2_94750_c0_seq1:322-1011(-)
MMTCSEGTPALYGLTNDTVGPIEEMTCPLVKALEQGMAVSQVCSLKAQWDNVKSQSSYAGDGTVSTRSGSMSSSPISESPRLSDRASSPLPASSHVSDLLQRDQLSNTIVSSEALTCGWHSDSPQEVSFPDIASYSPYPGAWAQVSGTRSDEMMSSLACLASVLMTSERYEIDDGDSMFDDCLADMNAHFFTSGAESLPAKCEVGNFSDDDGNFSDDDCLTDTNTDVRS